MQSNKYRNFTFTEINNLIDNWITDTLNIQTVFTNQADFVKRFYFQKELHEYKLRQMNAWLNLLYYHQSRLEADLATVLRNLSLIEAHLKNLEAKLPNIEDIREIDPARARLYDALDGVCTSMGHWKEFSEIYCRGICQVDRENLTDPAEQLAKIMMCQLETLEELEVRLYKIMTGIANLETQKNMILRWPNRCLCWKPC